MTSRESTPRGREHPPPGGTNTKDRNKKLLRRKSGSWDHLQSMPRRTLLARRPQRGVCPGCATRRCLLRGQSPPLPAAAACGSTTRRQCNMARAGGRRQGGWQSTLNIQQKGDWCCYMNQTRCSTGPTGEWCRIGGDFSRHRNGESPGSYGRARLPTTPPTSTGSSAGGGKCR